LPYVLLTLPNERDVTGFTFLMPVPRHGVIIIVIDIGLMTVLVSLILHYTGVAGNLLNLVDCFLLMSYPVCVKLCESSFIPLCNLLRETDKPRQNHCLLAFHIGNKTFFSSDEL